MKNNYSDTLREIAASFLKVIGTFVAVIITLWLLIAFASLAFVLVYYVS